jgi:hypothetical protein
MTLDSWLESIIKLSLSITTSEKFKVSTKSNVWRHSWTLLWTVLSSPLNQVLHLLIYPPTHQIQLCGQPTISDLNFLDTSLKPGYVLWGIQLHITLTLLKLQTNVQKVTKKKEKHGYTTVSFVERKGSPNLWVAYHPSELSSVLLSVNWNRPVL